MKKKHTNNSQSAIADIDVSQADEVVGGLSMSSAVKLTVRRAYVPRNLGSVAYCTNGGCTSHHCASGFIR